MFEIEGEYTTAKVHGPEDAFDDFFFEQVEEIVDHEAFENDIAIMPDGHGGAGCVIGFTMPIGDKVVPNTVGVDIGCGMAAAQVVETEYLSLAEIDEGIREAVPMGRETRSDSAYHIVNDFPWDVCEDKLQALEDNIGSVSDSVEWFEDYGKDYFTNLCERVGYDMNRAISSVGSLGGGNHFVEFAESENNGSKWFVVHSGSRGLGLSIAQHWQDKATHFTTTRKSLDDVPEDQQEYLKENWKPDADKIRSDFEGEAIQEKFDEVSQTIQEYGPNADARNNDLDWLEGEEKNGYLIDMVFAQTYAEENRFEMLENIVDELDVVHVGAVNSTHNYIDFYDGVIRKGATQAKEGQPLIIPLNMAEGTLYCKGQGNGEWNESAPHGAGRRMSRTQAHNELSMEDYEEVMEDVFTTSVSEETLDEAPQAYKDVSIIEEEVGDSATIVDWWRPLLNVKSEW